MQWIGGYRLAARFADNMFLESNQTKGHYDREQADINTNFRRVQLMRSEETLNTIKNKETSGTGNKHCLR